MDFERMSLSQLEQVVSEAKDASEAGQQSQSDQKKGAGSTPPSIGNAFNLDDWMLRKYPDADGPHPWGDGGRIWQLAEDPWRASDGNSAYVGQLKFQIYVQIGRNRN